MIAILLALALATPAPPCHYTPQQWAAAKARCEQITGHKCARHVRPKFRTIGVDFGDTPLPPIHHKKKGCQ